MLTDEIKQKLDAWAKDGSLMESARDKIEKWLGADRYADFHSDILDMIDAGDTTALNDCFWAIIPLMIALFFFTSALIVTLMAEAGNVSPGTFAWLVTALDLGGAVGPLLAWTLGEWVDQTWMPFAIAGGLAAVAAAISLRRMLRSNRGIPVAA